MDQQRHECFFDSVHDDRVGKHVFAELLTSSTARYFLEEREDWFARLGGEIGCFFEVAKPVDDADFYRLAGGTFSEE